ncbi:MAG: alanine--glyoxylate aminotransferase [Bacillales bacterium]|jgi:aspartate aminotransferase-like enzyme|nr:alanine--glyoxylate aminotransferase [Bacillales bacterium]
MVNYTLRMVINGGFFMNNWSLPYRILMGPGPSDVDPDVLKSLSTPLVGHLDPSFLNLMNKLKVLLQEVFNTKNEMTLAMSGTGSAGMETLVVNLGEAGNFKGKVWRVGLMGVNARKSNVALLLSAFEELLIKK